MVEVYKYIQCLPYEQYSWNRDIFDIFCYVSCLVKYTCLSSHCQFLLLLLISLILFRCPHLSWGVPILGEKCFTIGLLWIGLLCPKLTGETSSFVLLIQNRQPPQWKPMRHELFLGNSLKGVFLPLQTLPLFMGLEENHIARDSVGVMIKHENDTFSITSLDTVCNTIIKLLE